MLRLHQVQSTHWPGSWAHWTGKHEWRSSGPVDEGKIYSTQNKASFICSSNAQLKACAAYAAYMYYSYDIMIL